jgi:hypothetical protein
MRAQKRKNPPVGAGLGRASERGGFIGIIALACQIAGNEPGHSKSVCGGAEVEERRYRAQHCFRVARVKDAKLLFRQAVGTARR